MDPQPTQGKPRPDRDAGEGVPARGAALRILDSVLRKGLPLESALDRAAQNLTLPADRALAHAITAAVLRHLDDLDALIDGATARPLPNDAKARMALRIALAQRLVLGTPAHAAIATVLPLVDGGPRKLVHGVFGTLSRSDARLPDPPNLPAAVAERWRIAWGDAVVAAAARLAAMPAPLDLSFASGEGAIEGGLSLAPRHLRLPAGARPTELPGFAEGAFWVQDIAASLPARLLGEGRGRRVIDLCAAPGGKTLQLAAADWRVTAVDLSADRLKRLRANLARTHLAADVIVADALTFTPAAPAEAVLLDAPCSATGIFRRHPDVLHRVRPKAIAALAERQQAMLSRAAAATAPGGTLLYSVCSLEPEEGEQAIEAFLTRHARFAIDPVEAAELPEGITPAAIGTVRVLPGMIEAAGGADGFFIARLKKK
ncbi:16S rRNA (cytosine967-C5)-methyltransferase [Sphingomonas vulcanisoli]|uniref:16S rRNA (Cytosine967-C5)-methyltransferase n=1 Tax=Sphingomonas vulcanisoli TaxID=1658060 RepID=A0ABX0TPK7_9SPHN|nr:transcription antitermination factor NusB [Sphingomonas vulcanisoli]NIJ07464.1 16S rRNA (cytosine967-C5)-methyltransferase [Sphingomonas vulcanisoli]